MNVRMAAAAVQGSDHIITNTHCQDSVYQYYDNEAAIAVIALSDGAGSCKRSEETAGFVTRWICSYMVEHFNDIFSSLQRQQYDPASFLQDIHVALADNQMPTEDGFCTLLFFTINSEGQWISGHIGDGIMLMKTKDDMFMHSSPENGAYPNITFFVNEPLDIARAHMRFQNGVWDTSGVIMLSSDGCQYILFDKDKEKPAPIFLQLCEWLETYPQDVVSAALKKNLADRFSGRTEDDMSIAMLLWNAEDELWH